jgi:excinuclease ABC subunit A
VDLGPGAGEHGGNIVFHGTYKSLSKSKDSLTAKYMGTPGSDLAAKNLHEREVRHLTPKRSDPVHRTPKGFITVHGAREHNLQDIDIKVPLGVFCCLTGVSGSGKSTFAEEILYPAYRRLRRGEPAEMGSFKSIKGLDKIDDMILVNQAPLGRSLRSNPATYTKAYDSIRTLMAGTYEARLRGVKPGTFSFNVAGGRCEKCQGTGTITMPGHRHHHH